MKIGVYGGTFNPPHLGHLTAARSVFELLGLDLLLLIPAGMPPHKEMQGNATAADRLEMLRLADCDIVQGYFYAKPMPIGEFRTFLQEFNERDN